MVFKPDAADAFGDYAPALAQCLLDDLEACELERRKLVVGGKHHMGLFSTAHSSLFVYEKVLDPSSKAYLYLRGYCLLAAALCYFHVWQALLRWGRKESGVSDEDRRNRMVAELMYEVMYAPTETESETAWHEYCQRWHGKGYRKWIQYLEDHWTCSKEWAPTLLSCYRRDIFRMHCNTTNDAEHGWKVIKRDFQRGQAQKDFAVCMVAYAGTPGHSEAINASFVHTRIQRAMEIQAGLTRRGTMKHRDRAQLEVDQLLATVQAQPSIVAIVEAEQALYQLTLPFSQWEGNPAVAFPVRSLPGQPNPCERDVSSSSTFGTLREGADGAVSPAVAAAAAAARLAAAITVADNGARLDIEPSGPAMHLADLLVNPVAGLVKEPWEPAFEFMRLRGPKPVLALQYALTLVQPDVAARLSQVILQRKASKRTGKGHLVGAMPASDVAKDIAINQQLASLPDMAFVPVRRADWKGAAPPQAACVYLYTITDTAAAWHSAAEALLGRLEVGAKMGPDEWGLLCAMSEMREMAAHAVRHKQGNCTLLTASYVGMECRSGPTELCDRLYEGLTKSGSTVAYKLAHFSPGRTSFISSLSTNTTIKRCVLAYLPQHLPTVCLVEAAIGAAMAGAGCVLLNNSPTGEDIRYLHDGASARGHAQPPRIVSDGNDFISKMKQGVAAQMVVDEVSRYFLRRLLRVVEVALAAGCNLAAGGDVPAPALRSGKVPRYSVTQCFDAFIAPPAPSTLRI